MNEKEKPSALGRAAYFFVEAPTITGSPKVSARDLNKEVNRPDSIGKWLESGRGD